MDLGDHVVKCCFVRGRLVCIPSWVPFMCTPLWTVLLQYVDIKKQCNDSSIYVLSMDAPCWLPEHESVSSRQLTFRDLIVLFTPRPRARRIAPSGGMRLLLWWQTNKKNNNNGYWSVELAIWKVFFSMILFKAIWLWEFGCKLSFA